jgi:hypothetical protein
VAKLHVADTNNNLSGAIDIEEENDEAIKEAASGGEELSQTTLYMNNGIVEPIVDNNAGKRNDTADAIQGALSGQVDAFSDGPTENQGGDVAHHTASSNQNKSGSWRRIEREETEKDKVKDDSTTKKRKRMTKEGKVELAATGPGATGKLSGADESARQGP